MFNYKVTDLFNQATLEVYRQLKDEYFGFVRQAGELDLQLKEMEVCRRNFLLQIKLLGSWKGHKPGVVILQKYLLVVDSGLKDCHLVTLVKQGSLGGRSNDRKAKHWKIKDKQKFS